MKQSNVFKWYQRLLIGDSHSALYYNRECCVYVQSNAKIDVFSSR